MTAQPELPGLNDPGLVALVMLLRFHGVGADPAQLRHQCGTASIGTADMIRCAKEFGLKARERKTSWARLATTPLPAIAALKDGGFGSMPILRELRVTPEILAIDPPFFSPLIDIPLHLAIAVVR